VKQRAFSKYGKWVVLRIRGSHKMSWLPKIERKSLQHISFHIKSFYTWLVSSDGQVINNRILRWSKSSYWGYPKYFKFLFNLIALKYQILYRFNSFNFWFRLTDHFRNLLYVFVCQSSNFILVLFKYLYSLEFGFNLLYLLINLLNRLWRANCN